MKTIFRAPLESHGKAAAPPTIAFSRVRVMLMHRGFLPGGPGERVYHSES